MPNPVSICTLIYYGEGLFAFVIVLFSSICKALPFGKIPLKPQRSHVDWGLLEKREAKTDGIELSKLVITGPHG